MYILYLFEAVYLSHDISLEKKGLECGCGGPGCSSCSLPLLALTCSRGRLAGVLGVVALAAPLALCLFWRSLAAEVGWAWWP
jgi:hypothetical protein